MKFETFYSEATVLNGIKRILDVESLRCRVSLRGVILDGSDNHWMEKDIIRIGYYVVCLQVRVNLGDEFFLRKATDSGESLICSTKIV